MRRYRTFRMRSAFAPIPLAALVLAASCFTPNSPKPAPTAVVTVDTSPGATDCTFTLTIGSSTQTSPAHVASAQFTVPESQVNADSATASCAGFLPATQSPASLLSNHVTLALTPVAPPVPPLPRAPTRDQLLRVRAIFQGLTVTTAQLGTVPSWGPEVGMLTSAADRQATYAAHKRAGATHFVLAVTCHYTEPGVAFPNATACSNDWSNDPATLATRVAEVVRAGLFPVVMQGGDELPWSTVRAQMPAWYAALKTSPDGDLTPYIVWCLGFDSVVPILNANDTAVQDFIDTTLATRAVIGNGAQVIEYPAGWAFWGPTDARFNLAGPGSYTSTAGQALDGVLQEFANDSPGNDPTPTVTGSTYDPEHGYTPTWSADASPWMQVWQIAARGPSYTAPADEPFNVRVTAAGGGPQDGQIVSVSADRQHVTSYAAGVSTPRGRFYFVGFEFATYQHVHGQTTRARVVKAGQYISGVGYDAVCMPAASSGRATARWEVRR